MTEVQLHDITLVPERTLGSPAGEGPLRGRLTFGWDLLPADHASAPADWRAQVNGTPGRDYRHLLLVCSFRPETPQSPGVFRHASLAVSLTTPDPAVRPVARLIDPGAPPPPGGGPRPGRRVTRAPGRGGRGGGGAAGAGA
ncbi:hypothetical protein ACFWIP_18130, partial [Streptomyces anulatus]